MAKILYFSTLVDKFNAPSEEVSLPESVSDVGTLLAWLRTRGGAWDKALQESAVTVTVNRQFAEARTAITDKMEIAIVPKRV